ncbi:hypothetical protein L7F22_060050 [Adiantum nelumboides]|nr:hypothetical protein [Adiantum nelumboides]
MEHYCCNVHWTKSYSTTYMQPPASASPPFPLPFPQFLQAQLALCGPQERSLSMQPPHRFQALSFSWLAGALHGLPWEPAPRWTGGGQHPCIEVQRFVFVLPGCGVPLYVCRPRCPRQELEAEPVLSLEPCVQGSTIVYAGLANGTIQVWDVASAPCCQVLSGAHSKAVTHLLTCDQLSALFSASQDGSIKMWTISRADPRYLELLDSPQPAGADAKLSRADDVAIWPLALCGGCGW